MAEITLPRSLISAAALGTAQHAVEIDSETPVGKLITLIEDSNQVARLLVMAATLDLQQKAGWLPERDIRPLPEPAPIETARPCSPRAVRQLILMLDGHYSEALPEWLNELAKAGQCAPPESLPMLLDAGRKQRDLRELIWPVLGARGRWLADQVKDQQWHWASSLNITKWDSWSTDTQAAALESWRRTDPAAAREFLIEKWPNESDWEARSQFARCLTINLSMDDEPFLEEALRSETSQGVRHTIAEILGSLPQSHLCKRMIERALRYVSFRNKGLFRKLSFELNLPDLTDTESAQDGVLLSSVTAADKTPNPLNWLEQMLSFVPPSFWLTHWNITVSEMFVAASNSLSPKTLINAWYQAAIRTNDIRFFQQLTLYLFAEDPRSHASKLTKPITSYYRESWSNEMTNAFLSSLKVYIGNEANRHQVELHQALSHFAYYMSPSMSEQIIGTLNEIPADKGWANLIDDVRLILEFRREMLSAIWNN